MAAMVASTRSVHIDRPPETVFAVLSDPANERKWRPQVRGFEGQGPPAAGTVIHQTVAGPGGMPLKADVRLTASDPPRRYAFQVVTGPARMAGEYRLEPVDGGTDLSYTLGAELRGIRLVLLGSAVQDSIDDEMGNLDRLKALVEGR